MKDDYTYVSMELNTQVNTDLKIIEGKGKIRSYNDDDTYEDIGFFTVSIMNIYNLTETNLFDVFDSVNDALSIYEYLKPQIDDNDFEIEGMNWGSLMVIGMMNVNKNHRNKVIGSQILKEILKWGKIADMGCIILQASAYESEKENKLNESKRLKEFYEKNGFLELSEDPDSQGFLMYYDFTHV
ncbi:GNAT family N-acetyltransferase [Jeotgalicoccus huakuii]|nr:GNAT family N-acetyltransferase [Jeotgalicoccus huakuii]